MKRLATYSQYFLRNPRFIDGLIARTSVSSHDTVLDIGAGSGIISSQLAKKAERVIAVEFEPRIAATLKENMLAYPNVSVVKGDFMRVSLPAQPYKVFSNIPFHVSSKIIKRLVEAPNPPSAMYVIVQKQFARKLVPSTHHFTAALGITIGPLYEAQILHELKRTDYWPHPNVDTVLLALTLRKKPLLPSASMAAFRTFVEQCYHDPKFFVKLPRVKLGISPERKPSELTLSQWIGLFQARLEKASSQHRSSQPPI